MSIKLTKCPKCGASMYEGQFRCQKCRGIYEVELAKKETAKQAKATEKETEKPKKADEKETKSKEK